MPDPKVSIGLAVYNGERYLRQAVDSILEQTFADFELIISDNASTDSTQGICLEYAARDERISYHRNATNIGGANNENLTFGLARGQYFRWAAHDDVLGPTLLEECVGVLDTCDDVVLSYPTMVIIDENDMKLETVCSRNGSSFSAYERFRSLTAWDHRCEQTYGLIRSAILAKTKLQLNYTDSDRTLLCELSLYGRFCPVPGAVFYKRVHPQMSTQVFSEWRGRMAWFGLDINDRIFLPHWMQFLDYLRVISQANMARSEKMRCYEHILGPWLFKDRHGRSMLKDIVLAAFRFPKHSWNKLV